MNFFNRKPDFVREAAERQQGFNIWLELLIGVAGFFVIQLLSSIVLGVVGVILVVASMVASGEPAIDADLINLMSLFSCALHTAAVILYCWLVQKRKPRTLGFVRKGIAVQYIVGLVIGFAMFSAAVGICVATGALEFEGNVFNGGLGMLIAFFIGFVIQGMSEEVFCRGFLMVSISRRYSLLLATIANSVLFAAMHLFNPGISPLAIVNLTLFGIFASVYTLYTENIWGVSAIHSIWNFVQGNFYGIKVSGMELGSTIFRFNSNENELMNGGAFGLEGGIAVSVVLIVSTAVVVVLMYCKSRKEAHNSLEAA